MTTSVFFLDTALLGLGILDGLLAVVVFVFPAYFDRIFFDRLTAQETNHLYRHGGLWLTFSVIQLMAYWFWTANPLLLLLVVGVRLSEWCADWIVLAFRADITIPGSILFFVSSPFTVGFGVYFFGAFRDLSTMATPALFIPGVEPSEFVLNGLIFVLVLVDLFLGLAVLWYPRLWKKITQGRSSGLPEGWLTRTGGIWLGFAVLQGVFFVAWPEHPEVLAVLAGMRFTEVIADWIYLVITRHKTTAGRIFFSVSPPINLLLGVLFYQGYLVVA